MSRRLPLYVLLASALVFLASLFLPWRSITAPPLSDYGVQGLLNHFASGGGSIKGWVAIAGDVSVLLVVATVLAAVVALRRPQLAARLPIGGLGVALGYFAVAVAIEVHSLSRDIGGRSSPTPHTNWTYGFYLGLASAGVAALSGLAVRRDELLRPRGVAEAMAVALGIGLLISFLLPWFGFPATTGSIHGTGTAAAVIAALVLILSGGRLQGEAPRRWRLPLAIAIAILTGGAVSAFAAFYSLRYGTWIGIGCAASLVALETVRAWPVRIPVLPRGLAAVRTGAAALLIVALFLPWQGFVLQGGSGRGFDGWYSVFGAAAGSLCLALLATPALSPFENYVLDAVVAVAIFVSVAGTAFREATFVFQIGYGAFVGIAAAGILLVTALLPRRPGYVDRRRALVRAVPLTGSVLCVAAIVVPLWFVLPPSWRDQAPALSGALAVPGVLLALYLVHLWARRVHGPARTGRRLTVVPLILLTLPSLELIRLRDDSSVIWGAVILVGLCLLLILFGWIEEHRGLEDLRVPEEIWRVDRLPEAES